MGNLSIEQRNALVEQYLWCIDSVMWMKPIIPAPIDSTTQKGDKNERS